MTTPPKARAAPTEAAPQSAMEVADARVLRNECSACIGAVTGAQFVRLRRQSTGKGREVWQLEGEGAATAETRRGVYTVVPFLNCGSHEYWLAVRVELHYHGGRLPYLVSASATVFEGRRTDERKLPLLRAEWACDAPDAHSRHAQPHWHVYSSRVESTLSPAPDFGVEQQLRPFDPNAVSLRAAGFGGEEQQGPFEPDALSAPADSPPSSAWDEHFHFAMASRWHTEGPGSHTSALEQDDALRNWLQGCLAYTREELLCLNASNQIVRSQSGRQCGLG